MNGTATAPIERISRFHPARIFEHGLHVITFGVLACTGLAQKFYSLDISQWLILYAGGIDSIRLVHRFMGIVCSATVLAHIAAAVIGVVGNKWQPSMVITKKDFNDLIHNLKYYLGVENMPAAGDRYTYKQKFEYWGILTGVLLMMVSGFILWFPTTAAHVLPGEMIPTAKVLHTNEALIILLIIAIWHVYNALFSPEIFPLDTCIFTGSITRERMIAEHPLELAEREGTTPRELVERPAGNEGDPHGASPPLEKTGEG